MKFPKPTQQNQGEVLRVDFRKPSSFFTTGWRTTPNALADRKPIVNTWHGSERLFSQVFVNSTQPMSITTVTDWKYLDVNESFLSLLGYTREEVIGQTSLNLGIWKKSEQSVQLVRKLETTGQVRDQEITVQGKEGQTRVWLSSADLIGLNGERCILVISSDITDRKRAERALQEVNARLIRAQEEERSRIARELHDGLNQRLALICVDLERCIHNHRGARLQRELGSISTKLQEASSEVHALSHQLHPSKLDHLGLVPTVRSLCRELAGRRGLNIEFISNDAIDDFSTLDKDVALCAYRVIQEALTNVIKHAHASQARVELKRQKQTLSLYVTDSGKGFNVEEAKLKGRLGLISMEERLRLAKGELIIRSKPMRGTQIEARIPIVSRSAT